MKNNHNVAGLNDTDRVEVNREEKLPGVFVRLKITLCAGSHRYCVGYIFIIYREPICTAPKQKDYTSAGFYQ